MTLSTILKDHRNGRFAAVSEDNALVTETSPSQDPIFDHLNGTKTTLVANTAADLITPPAGCRYIHLITSVDTFIRTDGQVPADAAGSILLIANRDYPMIPVVAGVKVRGISTGAAVVRATPMKKR